MLLFASNVLASSPFSDIETQEDELKCLALNIYHEARGEPADGQLAVAMVTINRVFSEYFPDTICNVVWQSKQFSWTWDGRSDRPTDELAWKISLTVAEYVLEHYYSLKELPEYLDDTGGALWYYNPEIVYPKWHDTTKTVTKSIGKHRFLKETL